MIGAIVLGLSGAAVFASLGLEIYGSITGNSYLVWIGTGLAAVGFWVLYVANTLGAHRGWAVYDGAFALLNTYLWWKNRHNRKRRPTTAALGHKARALITSMTSKLTPSPIPGRR